jgi:hypothetical protein
VPTNESPINSRFVDMKSKYNRTMSSLSVHESRVYIGADMFLVSGYWDPKADTNRSIFAIARIIWKGEISVVRAGKFIPYSKRMKDGRKADVAVKRYASSFINCAALTLIPSCSFAEVFKHRKTLRKFVPRTITGN